MRDDAEPESTILARRPSGVLPSRGAAHGAEPSAALHDLYRSAVLEHSRCPRNRRIPEGADRVGERHNPLCGDRIAVHVALGVDRIADVGFQGAGCAISVASASLLTLRAVGLPLSEARALPARVQAMLRGEAMDVEALGEIVALRGVARFPVRIPCAAAAWLALAAALAEPRQSSAAR